MSNNLTPKQHQVGSFKIFARTQVEFFAKSYFEKTKQYCRTFGAIPQSGFQNGANSTSPHLEVNTSFQIYSLFGIVLVANHL